VHRILALEQELHAARERAARLEQTVEALQREMDERVAAAHQEYRREIVPLRTAAVVLARDADITRR
jgi:predicted  nucleic acid-binding Zn-ribbon protein